MKVETWDAERDGPLSETALRQKTEQRGYRVSRYVYAPGTFFQALDTDWTRYMVVELRIR